MGAGMSDEELAALEALGRSDDWGRINFYKACDIAVPTLIKILREARAERDAMREALEGIADGTHRGPLTVVDIARAALARVAK